MSLCLRFEAGKKKFMLVCVQNLLDLLSGLQKSTIYATAVPEGSSVRDDLSRLVSLSSYVVKDEGLQFTDCDAVQLMKTAVTKKGCHFHPAVATFPVGAFMMESISEMLTQARQDQLLGKEFEAAADFATSLSVTVDNIIRKDKDTGAIEIVVPQMNKVCDMVAKFISFTEMTSERARVLLSGQYQCVASRIDELLESLTEAAAMKNTDFFTKLSDLFVGCFVEKPESPWTDGKSSDCLQQLVALATFQPWAKLPLARLLGKTHAANLEKAASSIVALGNCLQKSFPNLTALKTIDSKEALVMSSEVRALYTMLTDESVTTAIAKLAPALKPGIKEIFGFITKNIGHCLCSTASTMGKFLESLLETEIQFDQILAANVVGLVDLSDDAKAGTVDSDTDYGAFFAAFPAFFSESKPATLQIGSKKVTVHVSFLCLAGALLQMSKYVLSIQQLITAGHTLPTFEDVVQKAITDANVQFKFQALKPVLLLLTGLNKSASAFHEIHRKLDDSKVGIAHGDQIKQYHKELTHALAGSFAKSIEDGSSELDGMLAYFGSRFGRIATNHAVPGLFRAPVLDREAIGQLCQDADVKMILFGAQKAGTQCELIQSFLQGAKSVTILPPDVGTAITAVLDSVQHFASANNPKGMPEAGNVTLSNVTYFQASVSLSQAMVRTLNPGETRTGLISKCNTLLEKTKMFPDPQLSKKANQALAGK